MDRKLKDMPDTLCGADVVALQIVMDLIDLHLNCHMITTLVDVLVDVLDGLH